MIIRKIEPILKKALTEYPVVTIFGPRQSGKTTLAKACCPDFDYISLEDKETRELAIADYKALFARYRRPLIIEKSSVCLKSHRPCRTWWMLIGSGVDSLC